MRKSLASLAGLVIALATVGAGCAASVTTNGNIGVNGTPVACTMEAKQCPDGSYVGRVPPSCEFAPCPTAGATGAINANVNAGAGY